MKSEGLARLGATLQGRESRLSDPWINEFQPGTFREPSTEVCKHGRLESGLSGTHL